MIPDKYKYIPSRKFDLNNVGDHYDRCRDEADHWRKILQKIRGKETQRVIQAVERKLEYALHTGD